MDTNSRNQGPQRVRYTKHYPKKLMKLLKEMEICGLSDKEFRTILLKIFNELHEHTERQPSEISCTMQKENEKYNNNNNKKNQAP